MNGKLFLSTVLLLALPALPTYAADQKSAESRPHAQSVGESTEAARRVFEGSQFWWKHRSKVEDPTRDLGISAWIGRALSQVWHWIASALRQILQFLRKLMPTWVPGIGAVGGGGNVLLWALGLVAVAAIALVVYQTMRRRRLAAGSFAVERLQEPERLPDALVLMARAEAALQAGDTFEALRLGFQAILAALENRGILRYDRARTNSEYARDLRPQPDLATAFRRIAIPFDRAFYGKIRPERVDVEQTLAFCRSLMTAGALAT